MLAKDILAEEAKYHADWTVAGQLKAATYGALDVFDYKSGSGDFFYTEQIAKNLLLLHFTAGYLWGDIATLTIAHKHVSVAFVVGRSGNIYRLFNDKYWSNHLGKDKDVVGNNTLLHKRSVAVEISNVGPLTLNAGKTALTFAGSKYCELSDAASYTKLASDYRGFRYFASFTDAQYVSVKALIGEICIQNPATPRSFLPAASRYLPFAKDSAADSYKGIASHVNFRRTGKTDIGPGFDWPRIV